MALLTRASLLVAIFAAVLCTHALCPITQSFDSRFAIQTAMSIVAQGNTNLDEYGPLIEASQAKNVVTYGGHRYARYCIGVPLMAVPFVAVWDVVYRVEHGVGLQTLLEKGFATGFEKFVASTIVALASVLIFLIAERRLKSVIRALAIVFVFAYCTSAWSTGSRALWQHGPSMLLFSAVLYLLETGQERPGRVWMAGPLLAFSYVVRPTNILAALVLAAFVWYRYRRQFLPFIASAAPVLAAFFVYNYSVFGQPLSEYYLGSNAVRLGTFFKTLAGHLISPSRGLLVFSPVFLLVFLGIFFRLRKKPVEPIDVAILTVLALQLVMISFAKFWYGGHCFGPRYVSDMTPFLVWFLIPVVEALRRPVTIGVATLGVAFVLLAAASFYVHYQGATNMNCALWNARPVPVGTDPDRAWDWKDPQFLR